jgi:hypothetical protein
LDERADFVEVHRVLGNERLIDPAALQHHAQQSVGERAVPSWSNGEEQVCRASQGRDAWVDDNYLGAVVAGAPYVIG